ncbi:hypothetical protein BH11PLA2_BH11PLA2_28640 [soil metagenome]
MISRECMLVSIGLYIALSTGSDVHAQYLTEGFDNVAGLTSAGWTMRNNSTSPAGNSYFQGNDLEFTSHLGAANAYIAANFQGASGTQVTETISNWLITPVIPSIQNGTTFSFYTRTSINPASFPDRLQVRLNTTNTGTNVGTLPEEVGNFTTLLLDINSTYQATGTGSYPDAYTNYTASVSGLAMPMDGRFAFRYYVENGGPNGFNSNYIGIDTLVIAAPVPEPPMIVFSGLIVGARFAFRRWKRNFH